MSLPESFMVIVKCMTFNHHAYIKDAMDGFCMQMTISPYLCIVMDDCSTDGEQEVIENYVVEHFNLLSTEETDDYVLNLCQHKTNDNCYFAVFYLKYNHYSIKKSKVSYYSEWQNKCKYIAICEGDDYWIDGRKLQMQVDFLGENEKYSMVCCRAKQFSIKYNVFTQDNECYKDSQTMTISDIIEKGGLFITTCSLLYRVSVMEVAPDYCRECHVGDYPLQIMCAMKGKCYYFCKPMVVYRIDNPNSWVGRQKREIMSEKKLKGIESEVRMLQGFRNDYPQYSDLFLKRIKAFIILNTPKITTRKMRLKYKKTFNEEIKDFNIWDKIKMIIRTIL